MFSRNGRSSGAASSTQKPLAAFRPSQARPTAMRSKVSSRIPSTPARAPPPPPPPSPSQYPGSATRIAPGNRNAPAPLSPSSLARTSETQSQQAESYRLPASQAAIRPRAQPPPLQQPRAHAATQRASAQIVPPMYIPSPAPTLTGTVPTTSEFRPSSATRMAAISAANYRPPSAISQVGSEMHVPSSQARPQGQTSGNASMIMTKLDQMNAGLLARLDAQAAEVAELRQDVLLLQHANAQLIASQPPQDIADLRETVQNIVDAQSADGSELKNLIQHLRGQVHDLHQEVRALPTKDEAAEEIASQLAPALNDAVEAMKLSQEASLVVAMEKLSSSMLVKVKSHVDHLHSGLVKTSSGSAQEASKQARELSLQLKTLEALLGPAIDLLSKSEVHAALEQLPAAVIDVAAFRDALALLAGKVEEHSVPTSSADASDLIPAHPRNKRGDTPATAPLEVSASTHLAPTTDVDLSQVLHMLRGIREDLAQFPQVVSTALTTALPGNLHDILPKLRLVQDRIEILQRRHAESPCAQLDFQADLFQIQDMFNDVSKAQTAINGLVCPLAQDISALATHIRDTESQVKNAGPPTPASDIAMQPPSPDFTGIESIATIETPPDAAAAKGKSKSKNKARVKSKRGAKGRFTPTSITSSDTPVDSASKITEPATQAVPQARAVPSSEAQESSSTKKRPSAARKKTSPTQQTASMPRRIVPPRSAKTKNPHCPPQPSQYSNGSTALRMPQIPITDKNTQIGLSLRDTTPHSQVFRSKRTREAAHNSIGFQATERPSSSSESGESIQFVGTKPAATSSVSAIRTSNPADDEVDSLSSRTSYPAVQSLLEPSPPPLRFPPSEMRHRPALNTSSHEGVSNTASDTLRDQREDSTDTFRSVRPPLIGDRSFTALRRLKRRSDEIHGDPLRLKRTVLA